MTVSVSTGVIVSVSASVGSRRYSAKETYNFKEPTNRSHPIADS